MCVCKCVCMCLGWGNHFLFPMRGCLEFELVRDFDLWRFRLVLCREVILIQYSFLFKMFHLYINFLFILSAQPVSPLSNPRCPLFQGNLVHSVQQPSASSSSSSSSSSKCVVYSLAHHHKEACLLSAGSRGSVAVWKPPGWDKEEDGDGDDDDDEMADKWMSGSDGRKK